jgi:hypothetical protein
VDTTLAQEDFRYFQWLDASPDASAIEFVRSQRLTRMCFEKVFEFTPVANQSYQCQEYNFKASTIRDTHHDFTVTQELAGLREFVLMSNSNDVPWFAKKGTYMFFSYIGLGWLMRIIFVSHSKRVVYTFKKIILA